MPACSVAKTVTILHDDTSPPHDRTGWNGQDSDSDGTGWLGLNLYEYDPPQPYQLYANASAGTVLQVLTDPYSLAKSLSS